MIDHYEADVQTAQDYYPFGMIMPGRMFTALTVPGGSVSGTTQVNGYTVPVDLALTSRTGNEPTQYVASRMIDLEEGFESGSNDDVTAYLADTSYAGGGNGGSGADGVAGAGKYRYGFNGKEQDNEVKGIGDQIDYGMRVYDPRAGRFLSVDPLMKKFPQLTPFQYAGNTPTKFIDLDGAERFDPNANKPTGVTLLEKATLPNEGIAVSPHLHAGDYQLVGVNNSQGKSYWIARYTYTSGKDRGMYRDDYIVGTDGVYDFIKNANTYLWRANMLEFARTIDPKAGMDDLGQDYWDMWKRQASDPITWINLGAAWASTLPRVGAPVGEIPSSEPTSNTPGAANTGSHSGLKGWEELEHRAAMSDNPLSVATSTDGKTFRAVVQNIEKEYGGNVWDLMSDLNSQAQKAGASKLEVRGIEIVNSDLNKIFQNSNGKTLMGYEVNYSRNGSYGQVTLTKDLKAK